MLKTAKATNKIIEQAIYDKFSKLFPQFMNGEYNTMRLGAKYAKPLELEWVFGDRISIAHTYEFNGKPAYEPMIMFTVNSRDKRMTACSLELSEPPRNDMVHDNNGHTDTTMRQNINNLAIEWLDRIEKQGFEPVSATIELNDGCSISRNGLVTDKTICVTFDEDANPILPRQEGTYENVKSNLESDFLLSTNTNMYAIYQVSNNAEHARDICFTSLEELKRCGVEPNRSNYKLVYAAPFKNNIEFLTDVYPVLNDLYQRFNINHPKDFTGRSMSVSDVVVLRYSGNMSVYYVDNIGFVEISKSDFYK